MDENKFPPPGYVETESAVPGISVFMPAPQLTPEHEEVVAFNCPQCGAQTAYNVDDGGLKCAHCGFYDAPKVHLAGKAAQEFEFKLEVLERETQGWGDDRQELVCSSCGAHSTLSQGSLTHTCAFCGSNKVIQRAAPQDVLRPRYLVPFKLTQPDCRTKMQKWLQSHWLVPKVVREQANLGTFVPMYIPYWTFDASASAVWKAEVGYPQSERYYDASSKTWKTRTVIRWRWENGQVNEQYDDVLIPGTGRLNLRFLGKIGK